MDRVVEVDRVVEREVPVYVDRVVENIVERLVEVPVDRIVERVAEIPVEHIVEKIVEVPVDRVIRTEVPVPVNVDRIVETPVIQEVRRDTYPTGFEVQHPTEDVCRGRAALRLECMPAHPRRCARTFFHLLASVFGCACIMPVPRA